MKTRRPPEELRLLDVGCGAGGFVDIALRYGYVAEGVDPNLPAGLNQPYLKRKSSAEIAPRSYDIALLLNVAEHLVEPRQMFSEVRQLLKPDGVMLLTCPYGDSLARRVHRDRWGHLVLDEHLLFWTPRSLHRALREAGFQGKSSYRIAGSPFPLGRSVAPSPLSNRQADTKTQSNGGGQMSLSWQRKVWQMARIVQGHARIANYVRSLVHLTRLGDYLEYAIAVT
jgi:SAM-dependent methyltransferase